MTYDEKLLAPWWWWLVGLAIAVGGAAEVDGAGPLVYVLFVGLTLALLAAVSRQRIRVADGVLHVPGARAPLTAFGAVEQLEGPALRSWLGPRAQRYGYIAMRPWLTTAIRLEIADPEDETPYWLVGTRRPEVLLAALAAP